MSLLTNLVSAYTFETAAAPGLDFSGNGHHLTRTGTVSQPAGHSAPGTLASSWSDGGVSAAQGVLSAAANVIPAATSWTISLWVNTITGNWQSTGYDPFNTNANQAGCFLCHNQPSAFAQHNRQADLSHFPGKLPLLKLQALKATLIKATDTVKAPK